MRKAGTQDRVNLAAFCILAVAAMSIAQMSPATAGFTELDRFGAWYNRGLAWGDYDDDGDLDLAVGTGSGMGSKLYRNEGADQFTELSPFPPHPGAGGARGVVWADYDNDGDLDLAEAMANNLQNKLYRNEGGDNFTTLDRFGAGVSSTFAWGDYDNDGDLDLAVANWYGQQNKLYRNDGADNFTELNMFGAGDACALTWGDYNNDGYLDIAVTNDHVQNKLYKNEGDGTFSELDRFGLGASHGIVWGDYDNDGDLDIALTNDDMERCKIYRNDGNDDFTEITIGPAGYGSGLTWGDYDNDGDLDLAVARYYGNQQNKLYRNDGGDNFVELNEFGQGRSMGVAWGDYDNDGDIDLALLNDQQQGNKLYRNEQNDNEYIKVNLVGRGTAGFSNRDGVGAKVRVYDAGCRTLQGFREISAGGGYYSMPVSLGAHFGLSSSAVYDVEVTWPVSGLVDLVPDVVAPCTLTIMEGATCAVEENARKASVYRTILAQNRPNPARGKTTITYQISKKTEVSLKVYDVTGGLVGELLNESQDAGQHAITWNCRDLGCHMVAPGLYFYRLTTGNFAATKRMMVLP